MSYGVEIYSVTMKGPKGLDLDSLDLHSCPGFDAADNGITGGDLFVEEHYTQWSTHGGEEEFQEDLKKLQGAGVRGEVITDDDYGNMWKYRLTDAGVDRSSGEVVFPDDPEGKDDYHPDLVQYIRDNQDELPERYEGAEALLADTETMAKLQERFQKYSENARWDEAAYGAIQEVLTNGRN